MLSQKNLTENARDILDAENGPYLSVAFQRPAEAESNDKWDIQIKNIVSAIEGVEGVSETVRTQAVAALRDLDVKAARCGGWLLISRSNKVDVFELHDRPRGVIRVGEAPYILPVAHDDAREKTCWVLAVDRDHPGFYAFENDAFDDRIDDLEFRSYADMKATREPMAAINYHTAGPRAVGAGQAAAKFHALGVAADDYDEIQLNDFLEELAGAVQPVIAGTGVPLVLAGDPRRVGWMRKALDLHELHDEHIDAAGPALKPDALRKPLMEILAAARSEANEQAFDEIGGPKTATDIGDIVKAARAGRIDTLFIGPDCDGVQNSDDDERLRLLALDEAAASVQTNDIALEVLRKGGRIRFPNNAEWSGPDQIAATLRY